MTRADAARQRECARRILRCWHAATAADLESGLAWYSRAGALADALAVGTDFTPEQCAGVIAALSPRCGWSANVRGATLMVRAADAGAPQPQVAGLPASRDKAWRILRGEDPWTVLSARRESGEKCRSFYANICGDTDAVTVDVWAARAAEGPKWRDRQPDGKRYARIANAYRAAAALVDVAPRDMQAAVWTYYRREHARTLFDVREGVPSCAS